MTRRKFAPTKFWILTKIFVKFLCLVFPIGIKNHLSILIFLLKLDLGSELMTEGGINAAVKQRAQTAWNKWREITGAMWQENTKETEVF